MALKKDCLKKLPGRLKATFFNTLHTLPITIACMTAATLTANALFHLSGNAINVSIIYILAILLHAQYTKCYSAGIIASIYSVFWVNYAYTYPYMTLNFTLSGYPLTFVGMTFISCFTSSICIMLSKQSAQIQEKDRMLMQAEKETMRANLLRAMSHDLRTPLTTIIGSSATYLEQENEMSPEEKRKLIHNIEEDAQWLLTMVENLLSITRIQDGNIPLKKHEEMLEEVAGDALLTIRRRFPDFPIALNLSEDILYLPMEPMLIKQVIVNLLENAIRHSGDREHIQLHLFRQDDWAVVEVRDRGRGISPEVSRAVQSGRQLTDNLSGDSSRGMGIGLSVCQSIIKAHGGFFAAGNNPEGGAVFRFGLPMEETNHA